MFHTTAVTSSMFLRLCAGGGVGLCIVQSLQKQKDFQSRCQRTDSGTQGLWPVFAAQILAPELPAESRNFANDFNLCFSQNALYFDP